MSPTYWQIRLIWVCNVSVTLFLNIDLVVKLDPRPVSVQSVLHSVIYQPPVLQEQGHWDFILGWFMIFLFWLPASPFPCDSPLSLVLTNLYLLQQNTRAHCFLLSCSHLNGTSWGRSVYCFRAFFCILFCICASEWPLNSLFWRSCLPLTATEPTWLFHQPVSVYQTKL